MRPDLEGIETILLNYHSIGLKKSKMRPDLEGIETNIKIVVNENVEIVVENETRFRGD